MLKGLALDYFYINQLSHLPFNKAYKHLQNFFKRLGFQYKNLDKWNTIILIIVMAGNIDSIMIVIRLYKAEDRKDRGA